MPFKSEKQRKWMHANEPEMAKKWEKEDESVNEANASVIRKKLLKKFGEDPLYREFILAKTPKEQKKALKTLKSIRGGNAVRLMQKYVKKLQGESIKEKLRKVIRQEIKSINEAKEIKFHQIQPKDYIWYRGGIQYFVTKTGPNVLHMGLVNKGKPGSGGSLFASNTKLTRKNFDSQIRVKFIKKITRDKNTLWQESINEGAKPKKGDYVKTMIGVIAKIEKIRGSIAYMKLQDRKSKGYWLNDLKNIKPTDKMEKGKTLWTEGKINEGFEKYHLGGLLDSKLKKRLERAIKLWSGKVDAVGDDYIKFRMSSPDVSRFPALLKKLDHNKNVWIGDKRKNNIWDRRRNIDKLREESKRDYKAEYKKFQSSPKAKKYRAELNKYNRKKGTYGNGDGKDASHKGGKIVGFESQSKNRGRREKSRLKKEGFGGQLNAKDLKQFEKQRKENAEVLGYTVTGVSDVKETTLEVNPKEKGNKNEDNK